MSTSTSSSATAAAAGFELAASILGAPATAKRLVLVAADKITVPSSFVFGQLGASVDPLTNRPTWYTGRPLGQWVDQHTKLTYWPMGRSIGQAIDLLAYGSTYRPTEIFGMWVGTYV
ncbi:hypothetical protein BDD12DRAFT_807589 [Trichophaea hybrida]|nr:hypothetical protein BDD12DRAFT_807589 [Trichophaea hybrida]